MNTLTRLHNLDRMVSMTDLLPDTTVHRHGRDWLIRAFGGPAPVYYVHLDNSVAGPFVTGAHDVNDTIDIIAEQNGLDTGSHLD